MRNAVVAFFLIVAVVVVTKTGRDETPRRTSGTAALMCSVSPQRVTGGNGKLAAGAQFRCDSPGPDHLTLIVRLQRSTDGGWVNVAEQAFTATKGETSHSVAAAQRTRQVSAPCHAGVYRTQAAWSVNGGHTNTALGSERRNPCG
ncbi:hypothetical protein ABT297_31035 [Dactylosporangium sp. NPDC000555]|uniref:hypothetical protein n=1 Tax=Dactylosporangium sp. NPDC000555 TaxID=3154260 RepID=UPI0033179BAF